MTIPVRFLKPDFPSFFLFAILLIHLSQTIPPRPHFIVLQFEIFRIPPKAPRTPITAIENSVTDTGVIIGIYYISILKCPD